MTTTIGSLDLGALNDLREDVTQYFWFESNSSSAWGSGAHVTLYPESQFTNPNNANYLKGQNILMNTNGFSIRNGALPMMVLDNDSLDFNVIDTINNTYTNQASFGAVSTIGVTDNTQSYLRLDYHSMQLIDKETNAYFYVSDLRDTSGSLTVNDSFVGDGTTNTFNLSVPDTSISEVTINGIITTDYSTGTNVGVDFIRFTTAPADGDIIVVTYTTQSEKAKAFTFGFRQSGSNIGALSFANGYNVVASGLYSHAEGQETTASGSISHAEGISTTSSSWGSHAEGYTTTASGQASHAEGGQTIASGQNSHAEGRLTTASNLGSHAEGNQTIASATYTHAEGNSTEASASYAHAEGSGTTASGQMSHAECQSSTASGQGSHAEGLNTTASGRWSHAEGSSTQAIGESSHAEGSITTASASDAHAEGGQTIASATYAHAEGNKTTASGWCAHAEGGSTEASESYSHAQNLYTIASMEAQTTIGTYNIADTTPSTAVHPTGFTDYGNYAFIIGNGTNNNNRSNALTVDWQGGVAFYDPSRTFVVESVEIETARLNSGANGQYNVTAQKEGYYPIGVVGFSCVNGSLVARRMYIDTQAIGSCNAVVNVRNVASSAASASSVTLNILWVKAT